MSSEALWSVKGIDPRARDAAREAARREGLSLGDWLNRVILIDGEDLGRSADRFVPAPPSAGRNDPFSGAEASFEVRPSEVNSTIQSLDRLAERIETAEARSALAITGIDQSVYALVARLDNAERGQKQYNARLEGGLRELRATQNAVAERLRRMEEDDAPSRELEALRALESALSNLAGRVRQVEDGAADRAAVDAKLDAIAGQVDLAAQEIQRVSARADEAAAAARDVGADVSDSVKEMAERLTQAETATDAAVRALKATVTDLGERLACTEEREGAAADAVEGRLSAVTATVMRMIDAGREEVAREIAAAFSELKPGETESAITDLQARLASAERRQLASFERIGSEIDRLAQSLDQRLRGLEDRNSGGENDAGMVREEMARVVDALDRRVQAVADRDMAAIQKMGEDMARFAGAIESRVTDSEKLTAEAIVQVGAQIEGVAERLQERQQNAMDELLAKMRQQDEVAGVRFDIALKGVTQRLEIVERKTDHSPLHQALDALAQRIRIVEDNAKPSSPRLAPEVFDATSAKASVEPRVSGWGLFDATPAAPDIKLSDYDIGALENPEPLAFAGDDFDDEPLEIVDYAGDAASLSAEAIAQVDQAHESRDLRDAKFDDAFAPEDEDFAILEDDQDGLADLIEMLEAAAGAAPTEPSRYVSSGAINAGQVDAEQEKSLSQGPRLPEMGSLDFTRPAPASEVLTGGDSAAATSSAPANAEIAPSGGDEIYDLDPELEEAIFGTRKGAKIDPEDQFKALLEAEEKRRLAVEEASSVSALVDEAPEIVARPGLDDYLAQARRAALASQARPKGAIRGRTAPPAQSGALTRSHVMAAAGVAAVAAIGAGVYLGRSETGGLAQTIAQSAPQPNLAAAAQAPVPPQIAPEQMELALAALPEAPSASAASPAGERFPEASPTTAPNKEKNEQKEFAALQSAPALGADSGAGDAVASYQSGLDALRGGDPAAGAAMVLRAAQSGYAPAQYRLSKIYERGEGLQRNMPEARRWAERAAKAGNRKAMHDLAVFYAEGEGVRQNYVAAVEWFRKAAEYGLSDSQYNLGVLYEQGLGVSQDQGEALYWFEVAGRAGDQDAARRARELEATTPPAIVSAAVRRAEAFSPRVIDPAANGDSGRRAANVSYVARQ